MIRFIVVVVIACVACYVGPTPKTAPHIDAHPDITLGCVTAWSSSKARSIQATTPLLEGGYVVLSQPAMENLRNELKEELGQTSITGPIEPDSFNAMGAALHDTASALRDCMRTADPTITNPEYVVTFDLIGLHRTGMIVDHVHAQRVAGVHQDGGFILVSTSVASCFESVLRIELPPGGGPAEMQTVLRPDCVPTSLVVKP